ncbi:MAG: Fic family protein [Thermoanaerobaculaceae bacterium]
MAALPNAEVLLSPLTTQEAVLSSRIEGTQATFSEVLEFEAEGENALVSPERRADIHEVLNYRRALREADRLLKELPLCLRVVTSAHRVLMEGVRGHGKAPGELRRVPNWIGPPGSPIEQARFIPIGADQLPQAMSDRERYAHSTTPDRLVQLGILHAEFEALHPFLDGNGRLGRMLVPLFLWQSKLIQAPMFYISAYFESHRDEYYERLLAVSRDDDWTGWCRFFLGAVQAQAEINHGKVRDILSLYEESKPRLRALTRSQYAIQALDWLFERPIFKSSDFVKHAGIPEPTAKRIIGVLAKEGILRPLRLGRGRRAAILAFPELLNVAEGYGAF